MKPANDNRSVSHQIHQWADMNPEQARRYYHARAKLLNALFNSFVRGDLK